MKAITAILVVAALLVGLLTMDAEASSNEYSAMAGIEFSFHCPEDTGTSVWSRSVHAMQSWWAGSQSQILQRTKNAAPEEKELAWDTTALTVKIVILLIALMALGGYTVGETIISTILGIIAATAVIGYIILF